MTRDGIKKCLRLLQLTYPNAYKSFSTDDLGMLIEVWELQFRNVTDVEAFNAINKAISKNDYCPSIAEIKRNLIDEEEENEEEVWATVLKAGQNGLYGASDEWKKLPEDIKTVTTPYFLREIAMSSTADLRFIKRDFLASYRQYKQKKTENLLTTESAGLLLE